MRNLGSINGQFRGERDEGIGSNKVRVAEERETDEFRSNCGAVVEERETRGFRSK